MVEWAGFRARLGRGVERELDAVVARGKRLDSVEEERSVRVVMAAGRGSVERTVLMSAQKLQTRSMPLDNRNAEDTASRVIREEGDELYADDLEEWQARDAGGEGESLQGGERSFSSAWRPGRSAKWMRALVGPVTSRSKVFPSRSKEDVRRGSGSTKRLALFASSDWSHTDADGAAPPPSRTKEGLRAARRWSSIRSSVLSWIQDSERMKKRTHEQSRDPPASLSSSAMDADALLRDLITVGHLHEIAEEMEEEDEALAADLASFGKFLISAAQRHPEAGLTCLTRAASC